MELERKRTGRASASVPAQRDYAETNIFSWIYSLLIAAEGQICKESVVIEGGRHQQHQQPSACTPTHAGATLLQRYVIDIIVLKMMLSAN